MHNPLDILITISGINDLSGPWYGFWSGLGSDITEFAVFGIAYNKFKCKKCWRIGYHLVKNTHYRTCHKHATDAHHSKIERDYLDKYPRQHKFLKEK